MSMRKSPWALLLASAIALTGCSGSDDDTSNGAPLPKGSDSNTYAVTSAGRLVGFDLNNPSLQANTNTITGLASGDAIVGVAFRPSNGKLYALTNTSAGAGKLYTIDTTTGIATLAVALTADTTDTTAPYTTLVGTAFGVSFNAVPDRLRVVSSNGANLRINADTGAVITDTNISGTTSVTGAAYDTQFAAACRTKLYYADVSGSSDALYTTAAPNGGVATSIGPFGVDASSVVLLNQTSFTSASTSGPTKEALSAILNVGNVTGLYSVSTTSGAATKVANLPLAANETVVAAATLPITTGSPSQAVGDLVGLTTKNRLVSINVAAPSKFCSNVAVSNGGDTLLGIDRHPKDGVLYGVGASGTLYTLSTASGAGTAVCPLVTLSGTTATPYAFTGTNYAVNWNPVADRLRIVGADSKENLRVNPTPDANGNCAVTVDTAVSAAGIVAASYTNSTIGSTTTAATPPTSTALYGINTSNSTLVRIGADPATTGACPTDTGNPNCGQVTTVGALSGLPTGTVQVPAGFEISVANSAAYATIAVDGTSPATSSTLYTVNTSTGAVTAVGTLGGVLVRSLTTK